MKKILSVLAMAFACLATPSFAATNINVSEIETIDVRKLTPEQKAQLMSQTVDMQKQAAVTIAQKPVNVSQTVRTEATAWGELGTNMGKAAVATAKEVGMAANEFVNTPLGKITMGIVIFKVMGAEVMSFITGGFILVFFLGFAAYFILRKDFKSAKYENVPVLFGLFTRRVIVESVADPEDAIIFNRVCALIMLGLGLLVGLGTMF